MWVQFISPRSLDQWIHCFFISLRSLQPVNSFTIQWNHLVYMDTFCCSEEKNEKVRYISNLGLPFFYR
jgi:hypothetical protein